MLIFVFISYYYYYYYLLFIEMLVPTLEVCKYTLITYCAGHNTDILTSNTYSFIYLTLRASCFIFKIKNYQQI